MSEDTPKFPHKVFARYELNGEEKTHEAIIEAENNWHAMTLQKKFHLPSGAKIKAQSANKVRPTA